MFASFKEIMQCVKSHWSLVMISWLAIQSIALFPASPLYADSPTVVDPSFGVEVEYASEKFIQPKSHKIKDAHYKKMLEVVKKIFEPNSSSRNNPVRMVPYESPTQPNAKKAVYTDPLGRVWEVVPESLNTTGLDGFEWVTPVLKGEEDQKKLITILKEIEKTGEFGKGIRSSNHFTFDVSHLFSKNGDASQLVDLILNIENHWLEIYNTVSPTRYGTIINRFAVPLAYDQPELLRELSALPRNQRTYSRVQDIFKKYEEKELLLKGDNSRKAWKYRAANYKKLFGLTETPEIPVIEFRMTDFSKPELVEKNLAFLKKLIQLGPQLENRPVFKDPFRKTRDEIISISEANERIGKLKKTQYKSFLNKLGFQPKDYPQLAQLEGPVHVGMTEKERALLISKTNFENPVKINQKAITFGFETEFRGDRGSRIIENIGDPGARVRPELNFLVDDFHTEGSGNYEVISKPEKKLENLVKQMKKMKNTLQSDLRGFHLHMRFPKELIEKIGRENFDGWVARLSDRVTAWRVQNRMHYFGLKTWSNSRLNPEAVKDRGTMRVKSFDIDGMVDLEIRGLMSDEDAISDLTKIIVTGLKNPELINGYYPEQRMMYDYPNDLKKTMAAFVEKYHHRPLKARELEAIQVMMNAVNDKSMHLPLARWDQASYLSDLDRKLIADANFEFKKEVYTVMQNHVNHKYSSTQELEKQYRWRIKRWAKSIDLEKILEKSLLGKKVDTKTTHTKIIERILDLDPYDQTEEILFFFDTIKNEDEQLNAIRLLAKQKSSLQPDVIPLLAESFLESDFNSVRIKGIDFLQDSPWIDQESILRRALRDPSTEVRMHALEKLKGVSDEGAEHLLTEAISDQNRSIRKRAKELQAEYLVIREGQPTSAETRPRHRPRRNCTSQALHSIL